MPVDEPSSPGLKSAKGELILDKFLENAKNLYGLKEYELSRAPGHEGGRNQIYICKRNGIPEYVLRFSDNGYRYREGAPLDEYFYNTGKTLGTIHRLSKVYKPLNKRTEFFDKYNQEYIEELIPDEYKDLKIAIGERLEDFYKLPVDESVYGLVHFDFSDGNYHIDMDTGDITVFDFDNCMYCWYMFDLANLWINGTGWFQNEPDPRKRMDGMKGYFDTVLAGYRSETDISDEEVSKLQLFIDMVLIENIVDEFEWSAREGKELDPEDIEDAAECLIRHIAYAGF